MSKTFNVKKRQGAPDFVIGSFGFKLEEIEQYQNTKGYVNFDILKGKEDGIYIKVSEYGVNGNSDTPTFN